MSFDTVKNGIVARLKGLGYQESTEPFDFEDASRLEYGNTFILNRVSGELVEGADEGGETIVDRFYDTQSWVIQIAFEKSAQNDVIYRDDLQRKLDNIIADLDNPSNWSSFVRVLKYQSWNMEPTDNYYLLTINLNVIDTYTY